MSLEQRACRQPMCLHP